MTDDTASLIPEHPEALRGGQDALAGRMDRSELRMSSPGQYIASLRQDIALLRGDFAGQSLRFDRPERRVEHIEQAPGSAGLVH